jgi:DNA-binding NarL/FixJ family response regulator
VKLFSSSRRKSAVDEMVVVPHERAPEPVQVKPLHGHQVSVVIVDDDDDMRFVLRVALESAGFRVAEDVSDAESAMESIGRNRPDIVLLDLHMPDIGGLEILPLIYEDLPTTKVVVISAISATYMTEAALAEGAWGYIVKGVSARSIAEHLVHVTASGAVRPVRPYPLSRNYEDPKQLHA